MRLNYSSEAFPFGDFMSMVITLFVMIMILTFYFLNFNFPACQDDYVSCSKWKAAGDCKKNVKFMSKHCARSCDTCGRIECLLSLIQGKASFDEGYRSISFPIRQRRFPVSL